MEKDEKGGLLADSHNIFIRWRNNLSQLLNGHGLVVLGKYSSAISNSA
jgi:hypothetical protein